MPRFDSHLERVGAVAAILLVGSLLPSPLARRPEFSTLGPDKFLHLLGPAGFTAVLVEALASEHQTPTPFAVAVSVCVSTAYGVALGHLQRWVPGREPERADDGAQLLGSILGVVAWYWNDTPLRLRREPYTASGSRSPPVCGGS